MKLVFLVFSILIVYCMTSITCLQWDKSKNVEIDEFINRLLSSRKFDELAEKIADKAVKRIQSLDNINHNILRKNRKEKYGDFGGNYKRFKEDRYDTDKQVYVDKFDKERKPTKITENEKAVTDIAKAVSNPQESLQLKYKYLTRNVIANVYKKKKQINTDIRKDPISEHFEEETTPRTYITQEKSFKNHKSILEKGNKGHGNEIKEELFSQTYNDEADNVKIYVKSNIDVSTEQSILASDMETKLPNLDSEEKQLTSHVDGKRNSEISEENANTKIDKKYKDEVSNVDEDGVRIYNITKSVVEDDREFKNIYSRENVNNKETEVPYDNFNKEDSQSFKDVSVNNKNIESVENRANTEGENEIPHVSEEKVESTVKHRLQKEGHKVYTFESSPDYDEYHENVDKLKHTKKVEIML